MNIKKLLKFLFVMNSSALYKQPLFWLITLAPIIVGVFLLSDFFSLSFSTSSAAIKYFHEQTKAQFLIVAISIPLGALVSRMHATLQTEESLRNSEDELVLEHAETELNFVKNLLTTQYSNKNGFIKWRPNNQKFAWHRAVNTLTNIFREREKIISNKRRHIYDLKIEELRIHLYSHLRYNNIPLPAIFFAGSPSWEQEYLKHFSQGNEGDSALKTHIENQIGDETRQTSIANLSMISPQWQNETIDRVFITYIYEFIKEFNTNNFEASKFLEIQNFYVTLKLFDDKEEFFEMSYYENVKIRQFDEGASKYIVMLGVLAFDKMTRAMSDEEILQLKQTTEARPFYNSIDSQSS